jgi:hypothetical protein
MNNKKREENDIESVKSTSLLKQKKSHHVLSFLYQVYIKNSRLDLY